MVNFVIIAAVALIVGLAAGYVYKQKKRGVRCIGCSDGGACKGNCGSCSCDCCK